MKAVTKKNTVLFSMRMIFLMLFFLNSSIVFGQASEVVVVVNKTNTVTHLSLKDLQKLFKGRQKTWSNNEAVTLFLPPLRSDAMKVLSKKIFGNSSVSVVPRYYLKAVFQHKMSYAPRVSVDPISDVSGIPGGISIMIYDSLANLKGAKIIKVEGLCLLECP